MSVLWQTRTEPLMGTTVTVTGGAATVPADEVAVILDHAMDRLRGFAAAWTRFDDASPLQRLNDDPRSAVPVPRILGLGVIAALDAHERSGGLVDPTLADAIGASGYDRTVSALDRLAPQAVAEHAARTRPVPARPSRHRARVRVSADGGRVHRRPGVRLDLGGVGKGLAADLLAPSLDGLDRWSVDVGGDIRIGGTRHDVAQPVHITHPVDGSVIAAFDIARGAVATSAVTARAWRGADGVPAHHLLDPSTGRPAWTGLLQATAIADTATRAERLAKEAVLRGPQAARALLASGRGGVLVDSTGDVEAIGVPA